jgi:hypothetical protein
MSVQKIPWKVSTRRCRRTLGDDTLAPAAIEGWEEGDGEGSGTLSAEGEDENTAFAAFVTSILLVPRCSFC